MTDWRPSASLRNLTRRAQLLNQARQFFAERDVLEVETPLLTDYSVTEPNIESFGFTADGKQRYLQTSPEYAMKRLLAEGAPDIFQICKSFRAGEMGALHNPEFTMIEWYRLGYDLKQIMQECVALIVNLLSKEDEQIKVEYISYDDVTKKSLGVSLSSMSENQIRKLAKEKGLLLQDDCSLQQCIDFLFSHHVEQALCEESISCVFHYPAAQAALSKLNDDDNSVAERFEIFYAGKELANGYVELREPENLLERFANDQKVRQQRGLPEIEVDHRLIAAQRHGLPECAGVAVGFDRVLMLAVGASTLSEVISFDWDNA
ncbi:MAG: EF-P lysine aminoacylase EpmA [Gammaproteobacteria bacterium]